MKSREDMPSPRTTERNWVAWGAGWLRGRPGTATLRCACSVDLYLTAQRTPLLLIAGIQAAGLAEGQSPRAALMAATTSSWTMLPATEMRTLLGTYCCAR